MRWFGYVSTVIILIVALAPVWAEDQAKSGGPTASAPSSEVANVSPAQQRAEWFKTLAAIAEEQAKPQPDANKIAELQGKLLQLRQAGLAPGWTPASNLQPSRSVPSVCPWGGPGLGMGMGRGPGYAAGMGFGRGPGRGGPRGAGFRSGYPMGPAGYGAGPAFVDRNRNGICDYYEFRWGQ
jgi:hypothetical protein